MHKDVLDVIGDMPGNRKAEPKKQGLSKGGKIGLVGTAVIVGAAYGGGMAYTEKYNGEPVSAQTLKVDAMHPYNLGLPRIEVIPLTFDPAALESVIGPENSVQMTLEEYEATSPTMWDEQNKTMTIPLSIIFKDDLIPNLFIKKEQLSFDSSESAVKSKITVNGLQQGDIIPSPVDGEIELQKGTNKCIGGSIFIYTKDSQGEDIIILFATTPLNNLINFNYPLENNTRIPIKRGDPIGSLLTSDKHWAFNGQIQIMGFAPLLKNFNLATTHEGKAIIITK
jgi:hypothetical protein